MSKIIELPSFYEDLTPPYLEKRKAELEVLNTCFIEGNMDQIEKVAHKIAGSGGSYGLPDISKIGKEIELAASSGKAMKVKELLEEFSQFLNNVEVVFKDQ